ncbi:hypothetical protein MKW94_029689 [Papaver nudicaule]|uniref:Uncharacterized protein n=1 Tax=Papaver nudicaule TaxID=74823 RepID=A0AA41RNL9_PAPNU|nr:hypothetical protein [Papaver nudicaule]
MYMTRALSSLKFNPSLLAETVPESEGPNSGYIVITDEETEAEDTVISCGCRSSNFIIKNLPLPQNQILVHRWDDFHSDIWFIPVLDQPLSSNCYYVIIASGKYKGHACTSSREEDKGTSCFCYEDIKDVKPKEFNHMNIYQQLQLLKYKNYDGFVANAVAHDGYPPYDFRLKGWQVHKKNSKFHHLTEALGLNNSLRMSLPGLNFPIYNQYSSPVVVGKWYCPFVFIKDGDLKDQFKKSLLYEMTLEQYWEVIYKRDNNDYQTPTVRMAVSASVEKETIQLFGVDAVKDDQITGSGTDGVLWIRNASSNLGLSLAIVKKMNWIQEIGGFIGGGEGSVGVEKVEEFKGIGGWKSFGCFVLVERFVLRRMDGTIVLTCAYKHVHQIQCKWE